MENPTITWWEDLPLDCLYIIFSKIGLDDLIAHIPFVCRSWHQASSHPSICRTLDFRLIDIKPSSPFSKGFSSRCSLPRFTFSGFLKLALARSNGAAHELRFSPLFPPSIDVLSFASKVCPNLKTLCLPRINFDDEARFSDLIAIWRDLERLEIESKPWTLREMAKRIGKHCCRFRGLKIRGSIMKDDVLVILDFLPMIDTLDLSGCRIGKEEVLAIVDGCRELKRFSVKECVGIEIDDEVRRRAAGIAMFEFEGCRVEDDLMNFMVPTEDLEQMLMYYDDCFEMWML